MPNSFDNLILIGRPACGKSEFIDFMKKVGPEKRVSEFHIGKIEEIDDFPWLYNKFLEDNIWEAAGHPRLYSEPIGEKIYNTTDFALYDFMIGKLDAEIENISLTNPSFYNDGTLFVEFARGHKDAYKRAFPIFEKDILEKSAILNISVSFEESCRRNCSRSTASCEQGVLQHRVPKDIIEGYYKENDWRELTEGKEKGYLELKGVQVPFVTMNNEPELAPDSSEIIARYKTALNELFELYDR